MGKLETSKKVEHGTHKKRPTQELRFGKKITQKCVVISCKLEHHISVTDIIINNNGSIS